LAYAHNKVKLVLRIFLKKNGRPKVLCQRVKE